MSKDLALQRIGLYHPVWPVGVRFLLLAPRSERSDAPRILHNRHSTSSTNDLTA